MSHPTPPVVTIHRNGSIAPLNYPTADLLACGLKRDTAHDQSGFTPYIPWRLRKRGGHIEYATDGATMGATLAASGARRAMARCAHRVEPPCAAYGMPSRSTSPASKRSSSR
jgi:hypothetical protein